MKRDTWLDGIKFVLIFLVIFGHCRHFTDYDHAVLTSKAVGRISHTIYLFHMPLFILLSGYFSKKVETKKFIKSTVRLLKIFIIFHILWIVINTFRGEPISIKRIISPSFTLWYILCIVYWRIIIQYLPEKFDNYKIMIPLSSFIAILGGGIQVSNELSIQRALTFMPIFFLGYYAKTNNWLGIIKQSNMIWFLIPAFCLIVIENKIHLDIYGREPYEGFIDLLKRILYLSSSIIISIAFIKCIPQNISVFSEEGSNVLFYYVYHSFILYALAEILIALQIRVEGFGLLGISLMTIFILYGLRKVTYLGLILK